MMANVRAERLLKIPAEPSPELLIPSRCSSNANSLQSQNSARILGIRASSAAEMLAYARAAYPTPQLKRE